MAGIFFYESCKQYSKDVSSDPKPRDGHATFRKGSVGTERNCYFVMKTIIEHGYLIHEFAAEPLDLNSWRRIRTCTDHILLCA
jgi:hypothetical protein